MRTTERDYRTYLGVTSAMAHLKTILGEPPDYYGADMRIHAAEGEGCHRICLDWLAWKTGRLPEWTYPIKPEFHPSSERWFAVLERCLNGFQEFVAAYKIDPIGIEQEDFSTYYNLVGHIDLPAFFDLKRYNRTLRVKGPIDLKFTASILESHRLQVRTYGRLDGMRGTSFGGIFHCNRDTGIWKFEEVSLVTNLDDVQAVQFAAVLYNWGKKKRNV
jgi:hypothetical protein